jgi:hypothetical protein
MKVRTHHNGVVGKNEIKDVLELRTVMGISEAQYVLGVLMDHLKYLQKNIYDKELKKTNKVVIDDLKIFIKRMSIQHPFRLTIKAIE